MKIINVAKDFSRYPAGRYKTYGEFCGEAFRERFLEPALRQGNPFVVNLDNTMGYGSSFLEEAFGGLLRSGFSLESINACMQVESSNNPSLVYEINEYLTQADGLQLVLV
jgi:hypothetical protein